MSKLIISSQNPSTEDFIIEFSDDLPEEDSQTRDYLDEELCKGSPTLGEYLIEKQERFHYGNDGYLMNQWKRSFLKKEIDELRGKIIVQTLRGLAKDYKSKVSDYIFEQLVNLLWLADLYSESPEDYNAGIIPRLYHKPVKVDGKRNDADRRSDAKKKVHRNIEGIRKRLVEIDVRLAKAGLSKKERSQLINTQGVRERMTTPQGDKEGPPDFNSITVPPPFRAPIKAFVCRAMDVCERTNWKPPSPSLPKRLEKLLNCAGILHPTTKKRFTSQNIRDLNNGCAKYLESHPE